MRASLRRLAVGVISASTLAAGLTAAATPAQASSYWTARNEHTGTCLTAGDGSAVFVAKCNGGTYQQWRTTGTPQYDFYLVQNLATGLCLTTGYRTNVNDVWQSPCTLTKERRWNVSGDTGAIFNRDLESNIRTSPRAGAVYSDKSDQSFDWSYYAWHRTFG